MDINAVIKKITDGTRTTKAFADVEIDNLLVIHNVRIMENENGRYLAMPYYKFTNSEGIEQRRDIVHPISSYCRNILECTVFSAYEKALAEKVNEKGGEMND